MEHKIPDLIMEYQISGIKHQASGIGHRVSGIESRVTLFFLSFTFLLSLNVRSDNPPAPVTTVGYVTNATTIPGGVTMPVTVTNFSNIGSIVLTLLYDTTKCKFVSATPDPAFNGMTVTNTWAQTKLDKIVITWNGAAGITLPDLTHLLDITFTYITGTSYLSWGYSLGYTCHYKKYVGGSLVDCYDTPQSSYYIKGAMSNRTAPVTFAPVIGNASPGNDTIHLTVTKFTNISSISLQLQYDSTVFTYLGFTANPAFSGSFLSSDVNVQIINGIHTIVINWFGGPVTLPDSSTLLSLIFSFSNAVNGYSPLTWYEIGPSCQYGEGLNILIDYPAADFYKNGLIYSSGQFAPHIALPSILTAPQNTGIAIPATVNNFTNVKSFTLSFYYDTTVMTYTGFIPNTVFGSSLVVTDNAPDTSGKKKIMMIWTGSGLLSLPDGSTLATLTFTYHTGTSPLSWVRNAAFCRFNDASGHAYYDLPKSDYYHNGLVASHVAPHTVVWYASPAAGPVIVPVKVNNFTNIGSFSLTLDYDPGVLTYLVASLVPSYIGGTFTVTTIGIGRLVMGWSGTATSLPDSTNLINLSFTYNGGSSTLAWFDDGTSSRYAEGTASPALYDMPQSEYYMNGFIGPFSADFSADNTTADINTTIHFTDQSIGSPNVWQWSFNPVTINYLNGTSSTSQDPAVQCTVNGGYSVTLTTSKSGNSVKSTATKTNYLHIGTPGLWTGITSSDWNTVSNWHNYQIPLAATNVQIPASAINWPFFNGNLTIGTQCNNITLTGATQLIVSGNFTVNTGHSLVFSGAGMLKVGGNWSNSGTFTPSNGTIEFYGPTPASILLPSNETFFNLTENKSNTTLTIPHSVTVYGVLTVK
jgi:hypothetical protein